MAHKIINQAYRQQYHDFFDLALHPFVDQFNLLLENAKIPLDFILQAMRQCSSCITSCQ